MKLFDKLKIFLFSNSEKFFFLFLSSLIFINIFFSLSFPVHPDEINWRVAYATISDNNYELRSFFISCGEITYKPSLFLIPFIKILSLYLNLNIIDLRIVPLIFFLTFLIPFFIYIKKFFIHLNSKFFIILVLIFSILFFSNSTFIWNFNSRPEHLIYPILGIFILILNINDFTNDYVRYLILPFVLLFILASVGHPKFLYLTPLIIYVVYLSKINYFFQVLLFIFLIFLISKIIDLHYFVFYPPTCAEKFPDFTAWIKSFSINPFSFFENPKVFFKEIFSSTPRLIRDILSTGGVNHFIFSPQPRGAILPSVIQNLPVTFVNLQITFLFYLTFITSFILTCYYILKIKILNNQKKLLLLYFLFIFILLFFNRTTNYYDVSLWIKLMVIGIIISVTFSRKFLFEEFRLPSIFSNILIFILSITFFTSTFLIYKNYYVKYSANPHWFGMNTPQFYMNNKIKKDINNFYINQCSTDDADLYFFDDHTFNFFKFFKNAYPITYSGEPFAFSSGFNKNQYDQWILSLNKKINIYSSCDYNNMISNDIFVEYSRYESLNLCCYKNF